MNNTVSNAKTEKTSALYTLRTDMFRDTLAQHSNINPVNYGTVK